MLLKELEITFQNIFKLLKNIYPFKSYERSKSEGIYGPREW